MDSPCEKSPGKQGFITTIKRWALEKQKESVEVLHSPWKMTDTYRDWHERVHSNFGVIGILTYTGETPRVMG